MPPNIFKLGIACDSWVNFPCNRWRALSWEFRQSISDVVNVWQFPMTSEVEVLSWRQSRALLPWTWTQSEFITQWIKSHFSLFWKHLWFREFSSWGLDPQTRQPIGEQFLYLPACFILFRMFISINNSRNIFWFLYWKIWVFFQHIFILFIRIHSEFF